MKWPGIQSLFRRRVERIQKLATDLDPKRAHFSGLLLRADEMREKSLSSVMKLDPSYIPRPLPAFALEIEKASFAAHDGALGMAAEAMGERGTLLVGSKGVSLFDGALGISYSVFIFDLLRLHVKEDGVEIPFSELPYCAAAFAGLYVYLEERERENLCRKALEIYRDMRQSNDPEAKAWHGSLSKTVRSWLLSTATEKRTKETDATFRELFASHLTSLAASSREQT